MYNFLVLGLVPGTDIQITFEMWLDIVIAIIMAVVVVKAGRQLLNLTSTLPEASTVRLPLDASQLHR